MHELVCLLPLPVKYCWVFSRLKSLSDDDLIAVLEQIHHGRFPLSLAAPSLHDSSADVNPAASSSSTDSYTSSSEPNADLLMDRQASHSTASSSSATLQEDNRRPKQEQPASVSKTAVGKLPETAQSSQEKAAAASLPDAWQQQSHRLQALTRPLVQRLQGKFLDLLLLLFAAEVDQSGW